MNTSKIKSYAIQARRDFLKAVTERANYYGIFSDDTLEPIEFKGDMAIIGDRAISKKDGNLRQKLVDRIAKHGFEMTMRATAYSWFNRFVALRYMELHDYLDHGYRVLSNTSGSDVPEILEHAADVDFKGLKKETIIELRLAGNKDNELYRLLITAQCNALHQAMPFLFEKIDNETELLLPDNLLHSDSPIRKLVTETDETDWDDVEIIGWIYQFYISEKKDEVIGKVVKSEDIPAATQLFTPNWIVKYMIQNTLGRMWLATYPESALRDKMEYYIEPAGQETDVQKQLDEITPKELNPEEITFLDPACGSGHILIEAYDVLKEIYLERGYRTREIPLLILQKNLFGLDIDDRAAQLGAFAVLMKARADDRRILVRDMLALNIMSIQASDASDIKNIDIFFKEDSETKDALNELVKLFEHAKTYGSLITVPEDLALRMPEIAKTVEGKIGKWLSTSNVQNIRALAAQALLLARKYDCVVTNPPYMGGNGLNPSLKAFAKNKFPDSKSDLFAMFIERNLDLLGNQGNVAMITMQSWMFLSSFEKLREKLLDCHTISSMAHLGTRAFDSIGGEVVSTTSFVLAKAHHAQYKATYSRLVDGKSEAEKVAKTIEAIKHPDCGWFFHASAADFKTIPGSPIAYWVNKTVRNVFVRGTELSKSYKPIQGLITGDTDRFAKIWHEVDQRKSFLTPANKQQMSSSNKKWFPYNKGGSYRKWYGNNEFIVNWENNGQELKSFKNSKGKLLSRPQNEATYFREGLTWTAISSSYFAVRYCPAGTIGSNAGMMIFAVNTDELKPLVGLLNSSITTYLMSCLSQTLNFDQGIISRIPILNRPSSLIPHRLIEIGKVDWDSYETSWDFTTLSFFLPDHHQPTLKASYNKILENWRAITLEMQSLEKENNRILIEAYGLQDELTPDVPLTEITLTCNPHYRYNGNKSEEELEALLQTDTIKELLSYSIGCMMGRYSIDEPGLIYAHSGNKGFDSSKYKIFPADDDGIIPIMDLDWFPDDTAHRFVEFIKVAWPAEHLDENLKFVAESLKPKNNEAPIDTIRRYICITFFKDHLKTYKKRPIYWLFSSGKQKAFECLVYLHRYNETTLSRMRSAYVTPLQGNIRARIEFLTSEKDAATSASDQRKCQKEIDALKKKQVELSKFDDELRHYADMKISLDLDDGVKINYGKFGNLLAETKAVTGKK